jgi:hypothetical protein
MYLPWLGMEVSRQGMEVTFQVYIDDKRLEVTFQVYIDDKGARASEVNAC